MDITAMTKGTTNARAATEIGTMTHGPGRPSSKGNARPLRTTVGQPTSNQELYSTTTKKIAEYIARTYDKAGEFRNALINLKFGQLKKPRMVDFGTYDKDKQTTTVDEEGKEEWREALKTYSKKKEARESNEGKAFTLIIGQCSDMFRSKMESHNDWETVNTNSDPIELLKIIKHCMVHKTTTRHEGYLLIEALENLMRFRQGEKMTVEDYRERLISLVDVYKDLGGNPGTEEPLIKKYGSKEAAFEAYTALMLIRKSDLKRYGDLQNELSNDYTPGIDGYPINLSKAYDMLVNYRPMRRQNNNNNNTNGGNHPKGELSFANIDDEQSGRGGGRGRGRGRAFGRGRGGGYQNRGGVGDNNNKEESDDYPLSNSSDEEAVETRISLRHSKAILDPLLILLDSCSSVTIISNKHLLRNIHRSSKKLRVHCGTGSKILNMKATLGDYPIEVWYDPDGPANIMSMDEVADIYRLTMDTDIEKCINMHKTSGEIITFRPLIARVYSYQLESDNKNSFWSFIQTVKGQQQYYTRREIQNAATARKFQNIIMRPSTRFTTDTVIKNLANCPITRRDLAVAEDIYGPNLGSIKGKTPSRTVKHVPGNTDPVPMDILERHGQVSLAVDIMHVNKVPILVTYSRSIRFGTVTHLINRRAGTIGSALLDVIQMYEHQGFTMSTIFADIEFEPLRSPFPSLNTTGEDDHVPEIERYIQTVKDRVRSAYRMLPFQYIPRLVLIQLVKNCILWLNAFPHPDGDRKTIGLQEARPHGIWGIRTGNPRTLE